MSHINVEDKKIDQSDHSLSYNFRKVIISQTISMIGDSFSGLALTWFIVQTGNPMQVGLNLALAFIPSVVLAPFIGSIVDKVSRKFLLWMADLIRLLLDLILIIFVLKGYFTIQIIYIYSFLKAVARIFYLPAQTSIIQQLTNLHNRTKANAYQDFFSRISMVVGPILAGISVKYFPMELVLGIDAATFLLSAIIIISIQIDESKIMAQGRKSRYLQHISEGLSYVKKHRWILLLSFAFAFVNGGNALANVARPFLVSEVFQLEADAFGVMNSFASIGAIVSAAILIKHKPKGKNLKYVINSILIWGLGVVILSIADTFIIAVLIQVVAFSMGSIMSINANVFYQNEIPPSYMGRVYAIRNLISSLAMPVGFLFGDLVIRNFGISNSFIVSGMIIILGAGFALIAAKIHEQSIM
ncbi:MAG: MFS transporter [Clostridia bacterium]